MYRCFLASSLLLPCFSGVAAAGGDVLPPLQYVETDGARAVVVGEASLAHTAQILPLDERGSLVGKQDARRQIDKVLDNLSLALGEVGTTLSLAVKINIYATNSGIVPELHKALATKFSGPAKPAVTLVITRLPHPDGLVAMDAIAITPGGAGGEGVKRVRNPRLGGTTRHAHASILPAGTTVYVSGQAEKGTLAEATRRTLESLRATLISLGLDDFQVVQLKAFLTPMSDVSEVEKELEKFYGQQMVPAVAFVEWRSTLPIEIELIASGNKIKDKSTERIRYFTPPGVQASPLYSRVAILAPGPRIYVSGLYGTGMKQAEGQIEDIFTSLGQLLQKTGSDFRHLAKATYYVSDDDASSKLNELRPRYYDPKRPPAASKAMVAGVGVDGKSIILDMIAVPVK